MTKYTRRECYTVTALRLGAYLSQDCEDISGGAIEAIDELARDLDEEEREQMKSELEFLLLERLSSEELRKVLWKDFGCSYHPSEYPDSRDWVQYIIDKLS